jgi:dihydroorotate dehydrogenase (NAD+) catalytic subunit
MTDQCLPPLFNPYKTLKENMDTDAKTYDFLGQKVHSLFGMAACPGSATSEYVKAVFSHGFDIVTYKTQRSVRFPANPFPNVLKLELEGHLTPERANNPVVGYLPDRIDPTDVTIANSCGINCEGPGFWMDDFRKAQASAGKGQLLIMSVVGTIQDGFTPDDYYNDFAVAAGQAVEAGAKVVEINLSCPNVASEGVICYTPEVVEEICQRVRKEIGEDVKLLTKVGYFRQNQEELLQRVVRGMGPYVDGIVATNTMPATIVDRKGKQAFSGPGREKAGVSGSAIKWAGIEMTSRLKHLREVLNLNYVIIGVGGVMKPEDYKDYIIAGADAVQSATGAMWNPKLAKQTKKYMQAPYIAQEIAAYRG